MAEKRKSVDVDEIGTAAAAPCATGCGFFGNAATGGMCSKCYREPAAVGGAAAPTDERKMQEDVSKTIALAPAAPPRCAPPEQKARIVRAPPPSRRPLMLLAPMARQREQRSRRRAGARREKVGLLGFRCCCGETFCGAHRYAEKHAGGFDYKRAGRERIARNNPVVVADKIAKI